MKKKQRVVLAVVMLLVLAAMLGVFAHKAMEERAGIEDYEWAAGIAGVVVSLPPQETPAPEETPPPDPQALALLEVDLDALREVSGDVVGWICIPDTDLSYPLMFSGDNSYYLNHTWSGERNAGGAIFLEEMCAPDLSDFNVIIYGHRMNNTTMFGTLKFYAEQDFWQEHPSVYLVDDGGVSRYDIFSAYEVGVREPTYRLHLTEEEEKREFVDFCVGRSEIETGIVPELDGQVLTLSTCVNLGQSDYRWVVQGSLAARVERPAAE